MQCSTAPCWCNRVQACGLRLDAFALLHATAVLASDQFHRYCCEQVCNCLAAPQTIVGVRCVDRIWTGRLCQFLVTIVPIYMLQPYPFTCYNRTCLHVTTVLGSAQFHRRCIAVLGSALRTSRPNTTCIRISLVHTLQHTAHQGSERAKIRSRLSLLACMQHTETDMTVGNIAFDSDDM